MLGEVQIERVVELTLRLQERMRAECLRDPELDDEYRRKRDRCESEGRLLYQWKRTLVLLDQASEGGQQTLERFRRTVAHEADLEPVALLEILAVVRDHEALFPEAFADG